MFLYFLIYLKLVCTPLNVLLRGHFYKYISLSMHILLRINVMLDFIWTLSVKLRGTQVNITQNHVHGRILTNETTQPIGYKSDVFITRPNLQRYEWRN